MRYIGIDVAKETLAIHVLPTGDAFAIANTPTGFRKLLKHLLPGDILGMESTATYHHSCARYFLQKGFEVRELNPIVTKQFIRATVRKKKTDKSDAQIIARLLDQGEGHRMTVQGIDNPVKKLFRARKKLIQQRSSLKNQLTALGAITPATRPIARAYKRLIKAVSHEIVTLEAEMLNVSCRESKILESIPGISALAARGILAEIGDIVRFSDKRKLIAFAGYDPKLTASGTSVYHSGKLTKRGSPALRNALYSAAFANIRLNTVFSHYYRKKIDEGKHFTQAMTATSRKILEVAYALLQEQEMFTPA